MSLRLREPNKSPAIGNFFQPLQKRKKEDEANDEHIEVLSDKDDQDAKENIEWRSINDEGPVRKILSTVERKKYILEGFEAQFRNGRYTGFARCVGFCASGNKPFKCVERKSQQNPNLKKDLSKFNNSFLD